jgi:hypothetical protein
LIKSSADKLAGSVSQIRGEGPDKQANKLNLGLTQTVVENNNTPAPAPTPTPTPAPAPAPAQQVTERKVYVDVDSVEEKNIIAEAYAKMALLIMENKRLRAKLNEKQN